MSRPNAHREGRRGRGRRTTMMIHRFQIPGKLPGLNEMLTAVNRNRYAGAHLKRQWTKLCAQYVVAGRVPTIKNPVAVLFSWIEPDRRRDLDNICAGAKYVLDALVETGRLQNDTRRWVTGISHEFLNPDAANPRVVVTLKESPEGGA